MRITQVETFSKQLSSLCKFDKEGIEGYDKRCLGHVTVYSVHSGFGQNIMCMLETGELQFHQVNDTNPEYCHKKFISFGDSILEVVFHYDNNPNCQEFTLIKKI